MRSPIGAALAAVAILLSGCGSPDLPPEVADPSPWRPPTQPASTAPPAPTVAPEPSTDPACLTAPMGNALQWMEEQYKRGAFEPGGAAELDYVEVLVYATRMVEVEKTAGIEVSKAAGQAEGAMTAYFDVKKKNKDGDADRFFASQVRSTMTEVARACGFDVALIFAQPDRSETPRTP